MKIARLLRSSMLLILLFPFGFGLFYVLMCCFGPIGLAFRAILAILASAVVYIIFRAIKPIDSKATPSDLNHHTPTT